MNQLPGGYKIGQKVAYSKWETTEMGGQDSAVRHVGRITGFDIRDGHFYFMVEYEGRIEEVKPEDILSQ